MRQIPLTRGKVAIVDDAHYECLNRRRWCAMKTVHSFYAVRTVRVAGDNQRTEMMHRVILGLQAGDKRQSDHRDGNGLNNIPSNLRVCTKTQNGRSQRKRRIRTSKYKGVCWPRLAPKWGSYICVNKRRIYLGSFNSEVAAAKAYDAAALKYHGEFALTNEMMGLLT